MHYGFIKMMDILKQHLCFQKKCEKEIKSLNSFKSKSECQNLEFQNCNTCLWFGFLVKVWERNAFFCQKV